MYKSGRWRNGIYRNGEFIGCKCIIRDYNTANQVAKDLSWNTKMRTKIMRVM